MLSKVLLFLTLLLCTYSVQADTPANCTYEDLIGTWKLYIGETGTRDTVNCSKKPSVPTKEVEVTFSPMTKLTKNDDNELGKFTLIYNQGFEFEVGYRKFFAFFEWQQVNATFSKYWCNRTMVGWAHDSLGKAWSCFIAVKHDDKMNQSPPRLVRNSESRFHSLDEGYTTDYDFINRLNSAQSSWTAGRYQQFENLSKRDILSMSGFKQGKIRPPTNLKTTPDTETQILINNLPESFDWRNSDGTNFVSPVRNQGSCGSCYTFAAMGMLEARIRIMTNNTQTPVFSTQEVVSCGEYSQGCAGGFPYLIAGKYAQDFGVVTDDCYPYLGKDTECKPAKPNCVRHYVDDYYYVGGYYGACSEDLMKLALVKNGPVAVGFEVYPDFQLYKSGIYHHVFGVSPRSNGMGDIDPFELTNHAVLVVGYGADSTSGEKYWIVKNSWGAAWGEKGYFRIRRGNDECGIESLAVESFPVTEM